VPALPSRILDPFVLSWRGWRAGPGCAPPVWATPPSTKSSTPVMPLASSLDRNATDLATSSGRISRPIGMPWPMAATRSSTLSARDAPANSNRIEGVSTAPGLNMLRRMPVPLTSWIQPRTHARSAALDPPYMAARSDYSG
jgi:hypothetical protein